MSDLLKGRTNFKLGYTDLMDRPVCKPSGFAEYDNLSGYVDRTYTTTWHDKDGNLWRKTCTVINLGRPDRGTPVDPDLQMAEEPMWHEPVKPNITDAAHAAARRAGSARREAMRQKVFAHIRTYGVATAAELATELEAIYSTVTTHLLTNEGIHYCRVGKAKTGTKPAALWGLIGVHDQEAL